MKISRSEIERYIKHLTLDLDKTVRFNHEGCATTVTSKSLSITRTKDGYVAHCFKCSESGFLPDTSVSPGKIQLRNSSSPRASSNCTPPHDAKTKLYEFAPRITVWLKQFLTEQEIIKHGVVADNVRLRCYFPVNPTGWIFRNFDTEAGGPKWFTRTQRGYGYYQSTNPTDTVVICEDCVSGIKLSRHSDALALLGTTLHDNALRILARQRYKRGVVFLDDDSALVKNQALRVKQRLELVIPSVSVYHSGGVDPKETDDTVLRSLV